jgi:hypothetical protein
LATNAASAGAGEESVAPAEGTVAAISASTTPAPPATEIAADTTAADPQTFIFELPATNAAQSAQPAVFAASMPPTALDKADDALMDWVAQANLRGNAGSSSTTTSNLDAVSDSSDTHSESTDLVFAGLDDFGLASRDL